MPDTSFREKVQAVEVNYTLSNSLKRRLRLMRQHLGRLDEELTRLEGAYKNIKQDSPLAVSLQEKRELFNLYEKLYEHYKANEPKKMPSIDDNRERYAAYAEEICNSIKNIIKEINTMIDYCHKLEYELQSKPPADDYPEQTAPTAETGYLPLNPGPLTAAVVAAILAIFYATTAGLDPRTTCTNNITFF